MACVKCGSEEAKTKYINVGDCIGRRNIMEVSTPILAKEEYLARTCANCGYQWKDPVLSASPEEGR